MTQLRETLPAEEQEPLAVFDSGEYSQANMTCYNQAKIKWISRVPETSTEAKAAIQEETADWHLLSEARTRPHSAERLMKKGKLGKVGKNRGGKEVLS